MIGTLRSLTLMLLAPPLVLIAWAHLIRPTSSGWDWPALIVAGLLGLVGVATAPWRGTLKSIVTVAYALLLVVALPFVGLLAVCSTGDCL
jgi:hypothetical protein